MSARCHVVRFLLKFILLFVSVEVFSHDMETAYVDDDANRYRAYLRIASPDEDVIAYEKAIRGILSKNNVSFFYSDYQYYAKLLQYKYGKLPYLSKLSAFETEDGIVKEYNKAYLEAYYNYVKGMIILDGEYDGLGSFSFEAKNNFEIKKACTFLRFSEKMYTELGDMPVTIIDYYEQLLSKIVDAYSMLGYYDAAAWFQQKKIEILYDNWERWGRSTPWQSGNHYLSNHHFTEYETYVELLFDSQQFSKVIEYTSQVMNDPAYQPYKNDYDGYMTYHITRSKVELGLHKGEYTKYLNRSNKYYEYSWIENHYLNRAKCSEPITTTISKYESGELRYSDLKGNFDFYSFYVYLLESRDYNGLLEFSQMFLDKLHEELIQDPLFYFRDLNGDPYAPIENLNITEYDNIIASDREYWHHANGEPKVWLTYKCRAIAYSKLGDFAKAVENQKKCVDNVRTDWEYDPYERSKLFTSSWETFKYNLYTDSESDELYQLAEYYRLSGDFDNAAFYYRKVLNLNKDILLMLFNSSSWNEKVRQWEQNNEIYRKIITNEDILQNPYFSDIVFDCSSMLKSFLLNVKINEHAAIDSETSLDVKQLWERKLMYEKNIEKSCYYQDLYSTSFLDAIDINAALEKIVPTEVLLPEAYIYEQVKAALKPNEVLVDFFVTDETYISDKYFYELCQLDTTSIGDQLQTFAMSICKADWSKPKVVPLYLDSAIDFFAITQERATNAVRDTQLGKRFWGQVIKEADVESGDVIYFTPTGNINNVPIEYLKIDEGVHVSDKYEIYRLTSWRQLLHPSSKITRDDSWALYVDDYFAYDVRVNTKCSTENQELRTLKTTDLPPLYGATNTYHHINRNGVAVVTKYNNDFTEYEFSRLNLKSPELIYIGSHGYFWDDNLTAQDSLYLYGKYRNYALSSEEKSMYRSGIIMREAPGYQMVMSNKFLTAKEISLLDLSTTKLACVSACSTGLGKISAEGVYGLQRGFKLAGVQSLLVSLWDVDDKATEILISAFYDNLRLGQSKYAALNNAQASVRNYSQADSGSINLGEEAIFADPYYWAGFVLIDGNE